MYISIICVSEHIYMYVYVGTPKSSILIRFSIINHPFWGTPIFGNIHMEHMGSDLPGKIGCFRSCYTFAVWLQPDFRLQAAFVPA